MLNLLEGVLIETLRLYLEISPYLILGFFFAGLLHTLLGEAYIQKHFAVSGLLSTIKAAVFGVPLPVCSCGVIPLAESLRKDGASKSATMSFLVSTPSSGIDSIMATYALMGPVYAVFRPIASFLSGILVGVVTHWQEMKDVYGNDGKNGKNEINGSADGKTGNTNTAETANPPLKAAKKKSFKEIFRYGFVVIPSEMAHWLIIGVIIGGIISAVVPEDFVATHMGSPILNYVVVLLISIPIYVCATGSIPIATSLIGKGLLPGAALAFLIAGPATNTVTISFLFKKMGAKITALYIISIIAVSIATGVLFDWLWITFNLKIDLAAQTGGHTGHLIKITSAILLTAIFIYGKFDIKKFLNKFKNKGDTMNDTMNDGINEKIHKIKVPDMNCQHCKMKIENALNEVPQINSINIDLNNREVQINSTLQTQQLIDHIKAEGYHPEA